MESYLLTLILLTWRIWWAPNNASRWQMGFNWAFKGLNAKDYLRFFNFFWENVFGPFYVPIFKWTNQPYPPTH